MRRAAFGAALAALLLMLACHAASAASPAGVPAPLASAYEQFAHNAAPVADAIKELFRKPSLHQVGVTWTEFWALIGPGGKLHPAKFLEHKGHLVIEGALLLVLAVMFLQQTYKPQAAGEAPLSEREIDQLCAEWRPEPLAPAITAKEAAVLTATPVVESVVDATHVVVGGKPALNLAAASYLGLGHDPEVNSAAKAIIEKYGVGSCGPRGFYGTFDVHLNLENELAAFMGCEEAIIYSYDIATVGSVIPAVANAKDVIVMDEHCSAAAQMGANLSRAKVHLFKHNDMNDLERILKEVDIADRRNKKPLCRRWIVVEGVYANWGDLAPLDQLYGIKEKYKYRLMVEESFGFGALGATGRGACEHFGLQPHQVECVVASLGTSLASVGGFCAGSQEVVAHQRLAGLGYCFSASLPPYLAASASAALRLMRQRPDLLPTLWGHARRLRAGVDRIPGLVAYGSDADSDVPLVHVRLASPPADVAAAQALIEAMAEHMLKTSGILVAVARYSKIDRYRPPPSLKIFVSAALSTADVTKTVTALQKAAKAVL